MDHVGSRYIHLKDYLDDLESMKVIMEKRGLHSVVAVNSYKKLEAAIELLTASLDSFTDIDNDKAEYQLYKQINSIPKDASFIEGGRGTPLVIPPEDDGALDHIQL